MALTPKDPNFLQRFGHFLTKAFYGANMKKHQGTIDNLHAEESKEKWNSFANSTKDPDFVKAVKNDPRSDDKLKLHAERLNQMHNSPQVANITGTGGKTYTVTKLPNGDYGCTCNDWRYKGSVNPGYKCKHIKEFIARSKK